MSTPLEIGRNRVPVSVGIVADAKATLRQLTDAIDTLRVDDWRARLRDQAAMIADGRRQWANSEQVPMHPMRLCLELQALLDRDATVVADGSEQHAVGTRRVSRLPAGA